MKLILDEGELPSGLSVLLLCAVFLPPTFAAGAEPAGSSAPASKPATSPSAESTPAASPDEVRKLVERLGSNRFVLREQAQARLTEIGPAARAELERALQSTDIEIQRRAAEIISAIRRNRWDKLDAAARKNLLWQFTCPEAIGSVTCIDGVVIFGAASGKIYALSAATGKELWVAETGQFMSSFPVAAGGNAIFTTNVSGLAAHDLKTGKVAWAFDAGQPLRRTCLGDGLVFAAGQLNGLFAVDALTGKLAWKKESCTIFGQPVYAAGRVIFNNRGASGAVIVAEANSGGQWQKRGPGNSEFCGSPVAIGDAVRYLTHCSTVENHGEMVPFLSDSGTMELLDVANDRTRWSAPVKVGRFLFADGNAPQTLDVHISSSDYVHCAADGAGKLLHCVCGQLFVLDANSGREEWSFDCLAEEIRQKTSDGPPEGAWGSVLARPPMVAGDGVAYVGGGDGLYAIDYRERKLLWKFPTAFPVSYRMTQADGAIYFSSPLPAMAMRVSKSSDATDAGVLLLATDSLKVQGRQGMPVPFQGESTVYAVRIAPSTQPAR